MKLAHLVLLLPLVAGCATDAAAGYRGDRDRYYVDARVTHVEPLYHTVRVEEPRRECWDEDVYVERPAYRSHTGTILGGIVGGVLGHELGGHHHHGIATAAGTVLGASIGRDLSRRRYADDGYYSRRERCEVRPTYTTEQRIDGYRVTYVYAGREHETITDYEPGDVIRVRVDVDPHEDY
ncbi:MAG: glycine zipper 2TM domain-containing protein [Immundisolibacter sp.]|uniref:glycine zipper 2TM domain-containing protein n=1 Tax=Immundisolibacter sp. TaxID=1934948 RepID=UPI003D0C5FA5